MSNKKLKILIVGDSFMATDPRYPRSHWSEMIGDYDILNVSQPGASNHIIGFNLYENLRIRPDFVVIGCTDPLRVTFEQQEVETKSPWEFVTSAQKRHLTKEQQHAADQIKVFASEKMMSYNSFLMYHGIFSHLNNKKIPFAFSLNLLRHSLAHIRHTLLQQAFYEHKNNSIDIDLTLYPNMDYSENSPWYHVDDINWQTRYATEVKNRLKNLTSKD